jgi:hypothetical protein
LRDTLASLTTERDRLRQEIGIAQASERAALAAEAGRATPVIAGWDRMQRALATIPDLMTERDTALALLVEEQRDHAATREELARTQRVIRNAHQAIRQNTTAAAVALAMFDTRDRYGPSLLDELKAAEAELEQQRPVIEAARAMAEDWRNSSPHGHVRSIVAAVDALGAPTPNETT